MRGLINESKHTSEEIHWTIARGGKSEGASLDGGDEAAERS